MENFMTIDEAVKRYGESVFGENDDISGTIENFPIKDRISKSSRRKKTYFKGKKRYDRIYQKGFTPYRNKESIIRGMMRKTNVVRMYSPNDSTRQKGFNHSNTRRDLNASELIKDYYEEAV